MPLASCVEEGVSSGAFGEAVLKRQLQWCIAVN